MQYQLKVNAQAAAVTDERGHICLGDLTVIIPEAGDEWGQWILRVTEPPSLDYVCDGYPDYEIPLNEIFNRRDNYTRCPGLVNWIKHLHTKSWGRRSLGDFVDAAITIGSYGFIDGEDKHVRIWRDGAIHFWNRLPEDVAKRVVLL